jgi:hypothetical protein
MHLIVPLAIFKQPLKAASSKSSPEKLVFKNLLRIGTWAIAVGRQILNLTYL